MGFVEWIICLAIVASIALLAVLAWESRRDDWNSDADEDDWD